MPNLLWAICCRRPLVDSRTNSLSLIDVVEDVHVVGGSGVIAEQTAVVTLWEKGSDCKNEEETFELRLRFFDRNGTDLVPPFAKTYSIPKGNERLRNIYVVAGLPVKEAGDYHWVIELRRNDEWAEMARVKIRVKAVNLPPPPAE